MRWIALAVSIIAGLLSYNLLEAMERMELWVKISAHASYYAGCIEAQGAGCLIKAQAHAETFIPTGE